MSQKTERVEAEEIPEVSRFLETKEKISRMKEAFPEVFEQFEQLVETYNAELEAAEKAVRARKVSCGPFNLYQWQTKYNAEKLYDELGRDDFLRMGGSIKTIPVYEVDKNKLESYISSNKIKAEVVEVVKETSPRYKKPEKISL